MRNIDSALDVTFGYKKIKVVIIWLASAIFSFATNVEGSTWSASVEKDTLILKTKGEHKHSK